MTNRVLASFEQTPAPIAIVRGPSHVYEFANEAYRRLIRVEGEVVGREFAHVKRSPERERLRAILDQVYVAGERVRLPELPFLFEGGEDPAYFDVTLQPTRGDDGAVDGIVIHCAEITELVRARRRAEELHQQLLQVQKLESLGVLAGGIAHDFNNLLTGILGNASTALLMLPGASPAAAPIEGVVAAARRAADLTRQLLAYSGKGHFQIRSIDLSAHVREIASLLEATVPKKVQIRLELAKGLPAVEADIAQLQQIVMNLVVNGAEAIGEGTGTVLVTTGVQDVDEAYARTLATAGELQPGRYVYLEVHDTGCGMSDETMAKIFDPFFTTKFTGRGLGLAAVLGIVRGHKGALKVYSTVGRGTTFKVLFPASDRAAPVEERPSLGSFQGSGLVLVIDDDNGVRRTVRMMLELFGFDVLEASDGRRGVEVFAERAADLRLVLLDMTMPEMSGEETFRELRAVSPDVPVILTSGFNEVEATRRFVSKGLAGFLQKPFTPKDLARSLSLVLESK